MTDEVPLQVESVYAAPKTDEQPAPKVERRGRPATFFAVSPVKLVVMSISTLGAYQLFWFYANWLRLKRRGMPRISPFWRTMFAYFTCYSLFKTVKQMAQSANVRASFSPWFCAVGWVILSLLYRLPGPAVLICFGAVFFLVPVQKTMNEVNAVLDPGHDPNTRFTAWNIVAVVLGGLVFVLAIVGAFLPDK